MPAVNRHNAVHSGDADAGVGGHLQDRRLGLCVLEQAAGAIEAEDAAVAVLEDLGFAALGDLL